MHRRLCFCLLLAGAAFAVAQENTQGAPVRFKAHRIGRFRSEACGVGDFNGDGRLDIVAGECLYLAPAWQPRKIRTIKGDIDAQGMGYNWDFMNEPLDVNGDGRLDVVSCSWHGKQLEWYENPGDKGGLWPCRLIEKNGFYEHGELWDIDGDGRCLEILPAVRDTVWYALAEAPSAKRYFDKHVVSSQSLEWGVGAGDVNGDGRVDILRPSAWFEAPARPDDPWTAHPLALGSLTQGKVDHTAQILVYDVNADGRNDIICSSAHGWGIFWYEQVLKGPARSWRQHVIDRSWTQAHALKLGDLDGDGDLDLVTGKRFLAHNGQDPEGNKPPGVYWYALEQSPWPVWTKHVISFDEGIGAGLNIPVVDIDGDGDLDIVVTGKWGGPVLFENRRITSKK